MGSSAGARCRAESSAVVHEMGAASSGGDGGDGGRCRGADSNGSLCDAPGDAAAGMLPRMPVLHVSVRNATILQRRLRNQHCRQDNWQYGRRPLPVTRSGNANWGHFCHAGDGARCAGGDCDASRFQAAADVLLAVQEAAAAASPLAFATVAGPNVVSVAVLAVRSGWGWECGKEWAWAWQRSRCVRGTSCQRGSFATVKIAHCILRARNSDQ